MRVARCNFSRPLRIAAYCCPTRATSSPGRFQVGIANIIQGLRFAMSFEKQIRATRYERSLHIKIDDRETCCSAFWKGLTYGHEK